MMTVARTARLHTAPTGRYHVTDNRLGYLDECGSGYETKAAALRDAVSEGYTHVVDSTYAGSGSRIRIPSQYRKVTP